MNRNLKTPPADHTVGAAVNADQTTVNEATVNEAIRSLNHLLTIARRGKSPGSSTGEKQCRALVLAILDNVVGLDGSATNGVPALIRLVQASPQDGVSMVRARIAFQRGASR